ncbi:MAG: mobilization protein [Leptospiraceae bacterium]|nr:hypothetical protein [Leptospiraceae bacterium]MCP5496615.1 mobilization protein [Leptospiraceae bacterium]
MKKIHLIGGEKGGVGKSVVARLLAQYFIDNSVQFVAFDTDLSHGALMRFYGDYSTPISVDEFSNIDQIIETALEGDSDRILVDLCAQSSSSLHKWIEDNDILELTKENGIMLVLWHVMDNSKDALDLLQKLLSGYGNAVRYVIVKNSFNGKDFTQYNNSEIRKQSEEFGAKTIEIKDLHKPTMRKVDHLSKSFWAAINHRPEKEVEALKLMERQRVKVWVKSAYQQFESLGDLL